MKLVFAFAVLLATTGQAFAQGVDMGSLFPTLTFPEPKPTVDIVTRDNTKTGK